MSASDPNSGTNGGGGGASNTANQYFGGGAGNLSQIAGSYGAPTAYATAFFADPLHATAIQSAIDMYGMPAGYPGDVYRNHNGWCQAYEPINDFYFLASLFFRYPKVVSDPVNCQVLKGYIDSLDQEKIAADQKFVADNEPCTHNSALKAIADLQGMYRGMYSGMSCDTVIQQQKAQAQLAIDEAIAQNAANLQLQQQQGQAGIAASAAQTATALQIQSNAANAANTANVAGTGSKGTNSLMVWGIVIAALVIIGGGAMIIFKKHKPTTQST